MERNTQLDMYEFLEEFGNNRLIREGIEKFVKSTKMDTFKSVYNMSRHLYFYLSALGLNEKRGVNLPLLKRDKMKLERLMKFAKKVLQEEKAI